MNIIELFKSHEQDIQDSSNIFNSFGKPEMTNIYGKLKFGFFPLGSSVLSEQSEIEKSC